MVRYKVSVSPSQTSAWSVCRIATSASWTCRGRSCRSTAWPAEAALSSAGSADATWPWGTSLTTARPARPPTRPQHCLRPPGNQVQTVGGCRLGGFGRSHSQPGVDWWLCVISPALCSSFTAGLRETCGRCKASLSAEDLFTHEVLVDLLIRNRSRYLKYVKGDNGIAGVWSWWTLSPAQNPSLLIYM